ncbi:MAG TPA: hypothetical protein VFH01_07150, partial [Pyrinomonadaceae bacterium]|nr:hypothetical protein [Pyrinomonadaceae bacterium]
NDANINLPDLNAREIGLLLPLLILMVVMGVAPRPFLDRSKASVEVVRSRVALPPTGGSFADNKPAETRGENADNSKPEKVNLSITTTK